MRPVIAIVGRPNVGKSTLFNRLTATRAALVADRPGVTRDRQYGVCRYGERCLLVVDTGGIGPEDHDSEAVAELMLAQSMRAIREAALLIWLVDARAGLTHADESLAIMLRKSGKAILLAVNKAEGYEPRLAAAEFYSLGLAAVIPVSAKRGDGMDTLLAAACDMIPPDAEAVEEKTDALTIAVLGRPNVGKSTLVNRISGEERVLTFAQPGTTRDSIPVPLQKNGKAYVLTDTAGVRRKSRIQDPVEKFSVIKSFDAIAAAKIIILVIDAGESATEQDSALLGMIKDSGKAVIVAVNKWDGLEADQKQRVKSQLSHRFGFIDYAQYHYISALHGTGVGNLFKTIHRIEKSLAPELSTAELTRILADAVFRHPPQMIRGRRIKLRYAHLGGLNPIRIIIHGNQTGSVPRHYKQYLAGVFRKALKLVGTGLWIEFKHGDNPYKDKKNTLTRAQQNKRRRLLRHVKSR